MANDFADVTVDGSNVAASIREYAESIGGPQNEGIYNKLMKQADAYEAMGQMPMAEAQRLKNQYKWSMKDPSSQSIGAEATNKLNRVLSDSMEDAVENSGGDLAGYQALKNKYHHITGAEESAEKLASRQAKNRTFSLTDYMAGGAGLGLDPTFGAVSIVGNKILRERGSSAMAKSDAWACCAAAC